MNKELITILYTYGFSDKEAKIYLILLELGTSPASTIARRSEIKRVTTYTVLEEMEKKEMVVCSIVDKIKYYSPVHPEVLLKQTEEKYTLLKNTLPSFLQLMDSGSQIKNVKSDIVEQSFRKRFTSLTMKEDFKKLYNQFFAQNDMVLS
jgi:sugar-specific transcriptional regulator TrmB